MKRVVVTGLGIISCIGNNQETVIKNLKNLNSGITKAPEYEEFSFRSLVHGKPEINLGELIDRRILRFMGDGAAYNYIAMKDAIKDSGLEDDEVSNSLWLSLFSSSEIFVGSTPNDDSLDTTLILFSSFALPLTTFVRLFLSSFMYNLNLSR